METFWDKRYASNPNAYGKRPNQFIKNYIDKYTPGKILFPGEGQGRNALYAASKNWEVDAFDYSKIAREQTYSIANEINVNLNYWIETFQSFQVITGIYDVVALCYVHLPSNERKLFYHKLWQSLKPGGELIMEAFTKTQLAFQSGGPKAVDLLFDQETVLSDFAAFETLEIAEMVTVLDEGNFHQGEAHIIRYHGKKI
jgi:2-polyprenyl-3-methyl-5-hydroxy-6-metoxy-1,4-benzoquinol methylase